MSTFSPRYWADSSELAAGQSVLAIGFAFALPGEPIITNGIVSATGVSTPASPQLTIIDNGASYGPDQ